MILRMTKDQYARMRQSTQASFAPDVDSPPETGCILFIAPRPKGGPVLLVKEVFEPKEGDICESTTEGLVFSRGFLRKALLRLRQSEFGGFLTVHTHPLSSKVVEFSSYDDLNDPGLMSNLVELEPNALFGSMVLGKDVANGRIWAPRQHRFAVLEKIAVVGENFRLANRAPFSAVGSGVAELFDRGLQLTGAGALATLAQMRIGVVGAGGTGSLMAELLVRAGAGEVTIFDFDKAEVSNLNRVLHLRAVDAESSSGKAERICDALSELNLPTKVSLSEHGGDIRDAATAIELSACDLIVGCVDRDWPRLVLCEIAYEFLIPLVDVGSEISAHSGEVQSLDARASMAGPGQPCLLCSGVVSLDRVRVEGFASAEQRRQIDSGYSPDVKLAAPAVMDLNMRAASMAMLIIRHLLQPFLGTPLAHSYRETVTSFNVRPLWFQPRTNCLVCDPARLGRGNASSFTTRAASDVDWIPVASKHSESR